jgi:intracellular multiplication protein IcmP
VSVVVGDYLRWPVAAYFCYCIWWCMYKTPKRRYRTVYNVDTFIARQAEVWPVVKPLINFKPNKTSDRVPGMPVPAQLPMFAESLSPEEWIAWARIPVTNGVPDKEALRGALTRQLGPKWEGMKGLKDYHRALIAGFALKGAQKRKEADDLLGAVATCWDAKGGLRLTPEVKQRVMKVLNDDGMMKPALDVAAKHAYRTTALLGILRWARDQGGVLAPAQFLWLRGEDRALWYPLNNLGRRSYHAEAAGAHAHFMAEQAASRALPMARVDNAIPIITEYLANTNPTIPQLEGGPRDTARLKMG